MDNNALSQEALEARREYRRKYYAEHKEQAKIAQAKYWEKKARESQEQTTDEVTE